MGRIRVPVLPRTLRWVTVVGITGFIFYTSILVPPPPQPAVLEPPNPVPLERWRQVLPYGLLAGSLWYATIDWDCPSRLVAILVIGATAGYGIGVEMLQSTVPQRYFSVADAYANAFGSSFAIPLILVRDRLERVHVPGELSIFGVEE